MHREVETYTGRMVDPLDLKPADVCIEDIAHALSMQCRYNGHCRIFYSVAEHSWEVRSFLELHLDGNREEQLAALMHDAAEAYLHDMVTPIKRASDMGALYAESERSAMEIIAAVFGLAWPEAPKVDVADRAVGWIEADALMASRGRTWPGYEPKGREWITDEMGAFRAVKQGKTYPPKEAERFFLEQFAKYGHAREEVPE